MEDTLSAGNSSSILDGIRDLSSANIYSIMDTSPSRSFRNSMDDSKSFFEKFKDPNKKKKKKKKKEEKEIEKITKKIRDLVGEASISAIKRKLKPKKKRKKINIRKIIKDFKERFPEAYFQNDFDLHSFFKNFEFDATNYHKMIIFLIKYADRSEVSINFLIWEKKRSLMSLMTKIFEVSNLLSQSQNTFYDTRIRFMTFVTQRAEKFIRKRNLQMKRVRLKLFLSLANWLKKVRDSMKTIKFKIQTHCIDGIFNDFNHLQDLLEKKMTSDLIQKTETTQNSINLSMDKFRERFKEEYNQLKITIANFYLDRFRYHFKEFLLIDLSQHIPFKTRENLFKFLAGSKFSPSWQSQQTIREMWNPKNYSNILDNNFMKKQFDNQKEILRLTSDIGSYITKVHPYPDNELSSLTSMKSISVSLSLCESQDMNNPSKRKLSASLLGESNISLQEHALVVSQLFVILNQLMILDTSTFSNEIMALFNPLSKQLKSELFKIKKNTDIEEIKKVVSPKQFKNKLVNDYFNMLWSFNIRLLLLTKVNLYGLIACSRNKGILITESPIIKKILGDLFFLANNVGKRLILCLKDFVEELFQHGVSFDELLGLKNTFIYIYNVSQKQFFNNLFIAEENFDLSENEKEEFNKMRNKVSADSFYNFLWKIELFCIKTFALNSLKNLGKDVENENWQDLNVSFDIVDMLRFILNNNNFVKKLIQQKQGRMLVVESENTLLKIEQKQFR
jgi:hypothetical protein